MASMLSVVPPGHPDLRELVVRCHRDPTVRSGTIWALGSHLASQRWGGFFDGRLVLDHLGLVGVDRQASRERLRADLGSLADPMDSSQRRKGVLVQFCC